MYYFSILIISLLIFEPLLYFITCPKVQTITTMTNMFSFLHATLFLLLIPSTIATPVPAPAFPPAPISNTLSVRSLDTWKPSHNNWPQDYCGDSAFHNDWYDMAPLISDCKELANWMDQNGGWIHVDKGWGKQSSGYAKHLRVNTCTFGLYSGNIQGSSVGNTDIRDLVRDAIHRYGRDGRVAVYGDMGCEDDDTVRNTKVKVHWRIMYYQ